MEETSKRGVGMSVKVRDFKHDGKLWIVVHHQGKRNAFRASSDSWEDARREADALEHRLAQGLGIGDEDVAPTFGELSDRYLREATSTLSPTTKEDKRTMLSHSGPVGKHFYTRRVDELNKATLLEWWGLEVAGKRSIRTGRNYLDALSGVLGYAVDLGVVDNNPVDELRLVLRRHNRTKGSRAATMSPKPTPIEDPVDVDAFVAASEAVGGDGHLIDLLLLDAGLRLGEVGGLRWDSFWWGKDQNDVTRGIAIEQTRPRGRFDSDTPKSGRSRRVALSRRLRRVLRSEWMRRGQPKGRIFPALKQNSFRRRHFARVCQLAQIGHRVPKDLRDTYASQLITAGIQLAYISEQLGHADPWVTARHYARWSGSSGFRNPLVVRDGEVPADLLSRLNEASEASPKRTKRHQTGPNGVTTSP